MSGGDEREARLANVGQSARALDRLLEHRTRLGACVLLGRDESLRFPQLRELLGETDGNLGAHLRKLEEAGYVQVRKEFERRRPVTIYTLTDSGASALRHHLAALDVLLRSLEAGAGQTDEGDSEGQDADSAP